MKKFQMERVFGSVGKPQFKGSGFYETDYKKKDSG
jgi:predicted nucleic acid-binding Zn ribbon protein